MEASEVIPAVGGGSNPPENALAEPLSFEDLGALLAGLPTEHTEQVIRQNLALVSALAHPTQILAILASVLADPSLLATIARRSYPHTNHFDKIVLIDPGKADNYRLTLHLWRPPYTDAEVLDEQIHMHRFNFWSNVLVGTLVSQNYVRSEAGSPFEEYRYIPDKKLDTTVGNFYRHLGTAYLQEVEPSQHTAGDSYHLFYERIHRIVLPKASVTCTLVLRGPRQRDHASVFSNSKQYQPMSHVMFSADELASRISGLMTAIRAAEVVGVEVIRSGTEVPTGGIGGQSNKRVRILDRSGGGRV